MTTGEPPTLEYEPRPSQVRYRAAAAAVACWLGLLATFAGIGVVIRASHYPADRSLVLFGLVLCCFGVTCWVLGLILQEALRRQGRGPNGRTDTHG
jgi:hypothetical protein